MNNGFNKRNVRGFSIYEHNILLKYKIMLNSQNAYYDSFKGSDIEGGIVEFETDRDGYIVPSRIYDNPDLVCAFLGDSSVECSFVNWEKRYPYLVGRILEKRFEKRINSFNAAVSGADTLSMIKVLLNKVFFEHPEIVFFCNTKSELLFLLSRTEDFFLGTNNNKDKIIYSDLIYNASFLTRIMEAVNVVFAGKLGSHFPRKQEISCHKQNGRIGGVNLKQTLEIYKNDLNAFVQLCISRNVKPILMTQANRYMEGDKQIKEYYHTHDIPITNLPYEEFVALYTECNELVRQVAQEQSIMLIDLEQMFENKPEYLYDAVHYTNAGSEKAARFIADAVKC